MNEKIIYEFVGKKVRQIRERADITQEKLATVLDASRASIANYEGGRQAISLSDLYKLADYLKVQITDFLPSIEEMKEKSAPEQVLEKAQDLKDVQKEEIKTFIQKIS